MKLNLEKFKGTLPYASEIFGVYTPLLGWKSTRIEERFKKTPDHLKQFESVLQGFPELADLKFNEDLNSCQLKVSLGSTDSINETLVNLLYDFDIMNLSLVFWTLNSLIDFSAPDFFEKTVELVSKDVNANIDNLQKFKNKVEEQIEFHYNKECNALHKKHFVKNNDHKNNIYIKELKHIKAKYKVKTQTESKFLSYLLILLSSKDVESIEESKKIIQNIVKSQKEHFTKVLSDRRKRLLDFNKSILEAVFDAPKDMKNIVLTPIGIVHLFRQYFFEFDTFLGTPVDHVWLSPGSSVTLIEEVSKKKTITKSVEQSYETTTEAQKEETISDEISDAVREENNQDLSLGASVDVEQSWGTGSMNASTSLDYNQVRNKSKEKTHKRLREQSSKISSKIRKSFKTNFKSVDEFSEVKTKKYTLKNDTDKLINYELRRKMRQVGVQVQDIGTYLSWQTFVDNPGEELGLANLLHVAKPADLDNIPREDEVRTPSLKHLDYPINLPFVPIDDPNNWDPRPDRTYKGGRETDQGGDMYVGNHIIEHVHEFELFPPESGFELKNAVLTSKNQNLCDLRIETIPNSNKIKVTYELINFNNKWDMQVNLKSTWKPSKEKIDKINEMNKELKDSYQLKVDKATKESYFDTVKERINQASNIQSRKFEELREEERIIVYRNLIKSLTDSAMSETYYVDPNEQHIISEVINSIFDIQKMLYFVAPDYWKPQRNSPSKQNFNSHSSQFKKSDGSSYTLSEANVNWGGSNRDNNYYITDESQPAKLGSSLGWLMQLDGDNMRNAFLNAPWVKAIVPIRPGKEEEALNWLKKVEKGFDENAIYKGNEPEFLNKTIGHVLESLAKKVTSKHEKSNEVDKYPEIDDDNQVRATPLNKVYEYGFYPLDGGFKAQTTKDFEIFDQWIEVLPTDQVAPIEVEYDPITGMQI
ncbi:hypothetical protein AWE51_16425 [Aquimarina aggregata]|uniref:Uncharacterized protein n=1 Tax=Aquimarina aggregata TaxID=1642818 RepID=A0A163D256_9FLAO|nr:hypothetical protein [Aquimarina aggregata]KZS42937.1 hypothetical protein AWE51_16425 [Aquimarina aggregata]